jgi:regulator of sigma D
MKYRTLKRSSKERTVFWLQKRSVELGGWQTLYRLSDSLELAPKQLYGFFRSTADVVNTGRYAVYDRCDYPTKEAASAALVEILKDHALNGTREIINYEVVETWDL